MPFVVLGDPSPEISWRILETLVAAGADALELGLPFSDPIADGARVQAAGQRALAQGVKLGDCLELLTRLRAEHPDLPVGLLTYANLVVHRGAQPFYRDVATAGVDSVLVADVPLNESGPFDAAARSAEVQHVFLVAPNSSDEVLQRIAERDAGYTYCLARGGVTGERTDLSGQARTLLQRVRRAQAPPPLLGFGISTPEHVRHALAMGARGAISGSAVVRRIEEHLGHPELLRERLKSFVRDMKSATALP